MLLIRDMEFVKLLKSYLLFSKKTDVQRPQHLPCFSKCHMQPHTYPACILCKAVQTDFFLRWFRALIGKLPASNHLSVFCLCITVYH